MTRSIEVTWPQRASADLHRQLHRVVHAVTSEGGAVGWVRPPDAAECRAWVDGVMAAVAAGDAALCVASVDGVVQATGHWRRDPSAFAAHRAEVTKVMAHPDARGLGLGRLVTAAVIDHAADAGIETLHLGVRGNNHLAVAIYEDLGFVEWGRLPDVVEVGRLRFDDVRMVLKFPQPPGVVWWGSRPGGPGGSPRPEDHPPSPPQR